MRCLIDELKTLSAIREEKRRAQKGAECVWTEHHTHGGEDRRKAERYDVQTKRTDSCPRDI